MHEPEEALMVNPLFVGLTRPPMMLGVTMDYLGISVMVALCGFILFSTPLCLLAYFPLHGIGVIACAIDPHIFRLLFKKWNCLNVPNKRLWGCQSYEPY